MTLDLMWIDISDQLASRKQPVVRIPRPAVNTESALLTSPRTGLLKVPITPPLSDDIKWATTASGPNVLVPIHAFQTDMPARAAILAVGLEYGARAAFSLAREGCDKPVALTLVMHKDVLPREGCPGFMLFLGMMFRIN